MSRPPTKHHANMIHKCVHCHTCGCKLQNVLDGEEWCPRCMSYRRYRSHGWTFALADPEPCPSVTERAKLQREYNTGPTRKKETDRERPKS